MGKEPFTITIIKWICWSFVFGVGIANIMGSTGHEFMMKMWVLSVVFIILSIYIYFTSKTLIKYTLIPVFMILGLASYQWKFDTFNPDHIKNFEDSARWAKTTVRGTIVRDPDVRDWITHVIVKPEEIIKHREFKKLTGRTGYIILYISRMIDDEQQGLGYYDRMKFGDRIEVTGALIPPMQLTNPYGFNYAKYLINKNIYESMYIGKPQNIKFIEESKLGIFCRIKKFAFKIKKRLILAVKKTIPPPHSAFIGGVTVGARGGVPEVMKYDFQATGVAHVLALSGLHVGFLAFMLIMVFNNIFKSSFIFYRLPSLIFGKEIDLTSYSQKLIPVFVVVVLFMFVIITGARPATVRAAMMYSIGIVFYFWLGMDIRRSGSVTIPMSAAIMLSFNSFLIYDASFALSFTAVWSIIYLSGPLRQIFSRIIVGWGQMVFLVFFVFGVSILVVSPSLFSNADFVRLYILFFMALACGAYFLEKKFPLSGFEFEGWWPYLSGFFCVQLAIQIGMMWPLSGVYFGRFPVAGVLANFIAIPLIGIVVPLGILGELFTFVPVAGDQIGLAIGAANTLFSGLFLGMAKFFRTYFPYPVQSVPSAGRLAVYYLIVLVFAFNKNIRKIFVSRFKFSKKAAIWAIIGLMVLLFSSAYLGKYNGSGKNELLVTFFDVGYGNCVLIQTPFKKSILIDGGARGDKRFWSMGKRGKGESVLIPNLAGYNISKLDKVILTNPLPENVGGLIYLLKHFNVKEVWDTLNPAKFKPDITYHEFLKVLNDVELLDQHDKHLSFGIYLNYYDFLNEENIPRLYLFEGIVLHRENVDGRILELKVLNPPEVRLNGTENDLLNNSAVLKLTYGESSFLFTSNILQEGDAGLVYKYGDALKSDVLLIPDHGSSMASSAEFLNCVSPANAIVQYGYLKDRSFREPELKRTLRRYENTGIKVFRTDKLGAVEVRTDGKQINIKTVLGKKL